MNLPSARQSPGISGSLRACDVLGCTSQAAVLFYLDVINCNFWQDIFGWGKDTDEIFAYACTRHYTSLKHRHGTDLGYRMRDGKIRAYVKDQWM